MKAFPDSHMCNNEGMDLRDYFAAKAMQAIIINSDRNSVSIGEIDLWIGQYAYEVADAIMKVRKTKMGD